MAVIVHRCTCTHLDNAHAATKLDDDNRRCLMAGCGCRDAQPGAPEIIPTWSTGANPFGPALPNPDIVPPGKEAGFGRACDCDDCQALYRAETAPAGVA
ncbi:hypothetical protein [Amycolatopsis orientalis]|uniref:hypothetical protein n=1 Tax=Amycolatopsis orientalis TaxID=31958 RepID=UPI0004139B95|nr:hypothetical protein [Amycolatopsis orientalis]